MTISPGLFRFVGEDSSETSIHSSVVDKYLPITVWPQSKLKGKTHRGVTLLCFPGKDSNARNTKAHCKSAGEVQECDVQYVQEGEDICHQIPSEDQNDPKLD